jgi:hypothetical protein
LILANKAIIYIEIYTYIARGDNVAHHALSRFARDEDVLLTIASTVHFPVPSCASTIAHRTGTPSRASSLSTCARSAPGPSLSPVAQYGTSSSSDTNTSSSPSHADASTAAAATRADAEAADAAALVMCRVMRGRRGRHWNGRGSEDGVGVWLRRRSCRAAGARKQGCACIAADGCATMRRSVLLRQQKGELNSDFEERSLMARGRVNICLANLLGFPS